MGPAGFEPATPTVSRGAGPLDALPSPVTPSHPSGRTGLAGGPDSPPVGTGWHPHNPAWCAGGAGAGGVHAIQGGAGRLLTVREVAERLSVSTATVYALIERGEIHHLR